MATTLVFYDDERIIKSKYDVIYDGTRGKYACEFILTNYKIMVVRLNSQALIDIFTIDYKDILKKDGKLCVRNANTLSTNFDQNFLEIEHKLGKETFNFPITDEHISYIFEIKRAYEQLNK